MRCLKFCFSISQHMCEQYWADNVGETLGTTDKRITVATTSTMPFADFDIRMFSVKLVSLLP